MSKEYTGGCHCGAIRFQVNTARNKVIICNCSICRKKGTRNLRVSPAEFELIQGKESLLNYQFGTGIASHFFCRHCGIHAYSIPRSAPDMINTNIQCLDDLDSVEQDFDFITFNGQHWEEAFETIQQSLS